MGGGVSVCGWDLPRMDHPGMASRSQHRPKKKADPFRSAFCVFHMARYAYSRLPKSDSSIMNMLMKLI
jgi:hypothetical protein